jgi:hypothetical protein
LWATATVANWSLAPSRGHAARPREDAAGLPAGARWRILTHPCGGTAQKCAAGHKAPLARRNATPSHRRGKPAAGSVSVLRHAARRGMDRQSHRCYSAQARPARIVQEAGRFLIHSLRDRSGEKCSMLTKGEMLFAWLLLLVVCAALVIGSQFVGTRVRGAMLELGTRGFFLVLGACVGGLSIMWSREDRAARQPKDLKPNGPR